jgi:hypothetical protein
MDIYQITLIAADKRVRSDMSPISRRTGPGVCRSKVGTARFWPDLETDKDPPLPYRSCHSVPLHKNLARCRRRATTVAKHRQRKASSRNVARKLPGLSSNQSAATRADIQSNNNALLIGKVPMIFLMGSRRCGEPRYLMTPSWRVAYSFWARRSDRKTYSSIPLRVRPPQSRLVTIAVLSHGSRAAVPGNWARSQYR